MSDEHYRRAGVDLEAAQETVEQIKPWADSTRRPGVMEGLGGFGALFSLRQANLLDQDAEDLILVSATDGVGTKLRLAMMTQRHDTIGIDCVAMCVNDVITTGAKPLFFLDYIAAGKLDPLQIGQIIQGIASGCRDSGCALIGGESAEMPGFYAPGDYDVAGFCVGAARPGQLLSTREPRQGDVVIGLPSSGLHSNGFSLVRALVDEHGLDLGSPHPALPDAPSLGHALLTPTRLYVRALSWLEEHATLLRAAHITGGGLVENIPRALPPTLGVSLDPKTWAVPPTIQLMVELGQLPEQTQRRVFNMGLGMVLIMRDEPDEATRAAFLAQHGFPMLIIGRVTEHPGVRFEP